MKSQCGDQHVYIYLNVVCKPEEVRVCVLHCEEHISSGYDPALRDCFDPDRKAAIIFLKEQRPHWRKYKAPFPFDKRPIYTD